VIRLLPQEAGLGAPDEREDTWSREDYGRHLAASLDAGTTPNGVFGSKLMWGYFNDFLELMRGIPRFGGMGDGSLLSTAFPGLRYVFISRSDKVRQAVSLWRALQTWVWRKEAGAAEDGQPERPAVYSYDAIDHLLEQLRRHEDGWRGWFFRIGEQPLQIYYEEIATETERTVRRVLSELGVEPPPDFTLPAHPSSRQSDEISEIWVQTYLEDVSRRSGSTPR
jgi:LPS sulfotransferase NodH